MKATAMPKGGHPTRPADQQRTTRTLGVIAVLGLLFGLVGMGEVVEDMLRIARNNLNPINASGDIVLVEIDDHSQREGGSWPWKRSLQADMIDNIEKAGAKLVVADLSYDFGQSGAYLAKLREGDDLVMGNRFTGGIAPGAMPALHRYLGNPVLSGLGRLFFRSPVGDFHAGMRGFRFFAH